MGTLLLIASLLGMQSHSKAQKWVGTWSCSPYAAANNTPPPPYLENNTFRQIVRTSIGGDTIRVKFSNITCSTPVTMNSVNIAILTEIGGSAVDTLTIKKLKFNGNSSVTMEAYSDVTSDPIDFHLNSGTHLAITIYYGECKTTADMTHHYGSRTDSYILTGNQTASATFEGATPIERWYTINTIDVIATDTCAAVVVLGNSITDGYGIHGGLKNTWPDMFSKKLLAYEPTSHVSVLNMGIGATWVSSSGVNRFQQDVLEQNGLRWIIVLYGINDIGGGASAIDIINAFKKLIFQAHFENKRIYGGTITPFKGSEYYSTAHESIRVEVNEWIRTPGNFDKCIDFDKVIRDPSDQEKLLKVYSNDWLHPNADGYKLLGESIDLNLFMGSDTIFEQATFESHYFETECAIVGSNWEIVNDKQSSNGFCGTVKAGIESKEGAPIDKESIIKIPFSVDNKDNYSIYARLNCPNANSDSFWVKIDDGEFEMNNGLTTSGWEWKIFNTYALTIGKHSLTIGYRETGAKLDKIGISNSPFPPLGIGNEAENICEPKVGENSIDIFNKDNIRIFPNLAESKTKINFSLDKSTKVSLKIYDIKRSKIETLVNKTLDSGTYSMAWNTSKISTGNYTCQFIAGNTTINKKILLID